MHITSLNQSILRVRAHFALCTVIAAAFVLPDPTSAADQPQILSRAAWGATAAIPARMKRQHPKEIIIHHTGVRQQPNISLERKLRGLQDYSQNTKRWGDSPYHYYIGVSGRIGEARDIAYAGDTNTRYSVQDRIQIVVEGHFDRDTPTKGQLASLDALMTWLANRHGIAGDAISGHNDHAQTDCPGKRLRPHLSTLRRLVDADGISLDPESSIAPNAPDTGQRADN